MKYKKYNVRLVKSNYVSSGNLAVCMLDADDNTMVLVVTVNLEESDLCAPNCAYVDTNNAGIDIVPWLEDKGIAKLTGAFAVSGYCQYPEMEFNVNML